MSQAFAKSNLFAALHSLSSASNALLYLNQLGPFKNSQRPHLICLDLNLPCANGIHFLEMLKKNTRFKSIPTVVLIDSDSYTNIQRCRDLGVDEYRVKPRTQQDVIDMAASWRVWMSGIHAE